MRRRPEPNQNMEPVILAEAENLFLERGYARATTVEIAKRAGCNQALVHYYFRSKEKLFQTIFMRKFESVFRGLVSLDEQDLPFEETIAGLIETHFDILEANPRLPFLILDELIRNPDRLQALKASALEDMPFEAIGRLERRLQREIAAGRVREMSLIDLAMTMVSLNAMVFVASPVLVRALDLSDEAHAALLRRRRQENVEVVIRSLRP